MDTSTMRKLAFSGATMAVATPLLVEVAHSGGAGIIVGLFSGWVAWEIQKDIDHAKGEDTAPSPPRVSRKVQDSWAYKLAIGKTMRPAPVESAAEPHADSDLLRPRRPWLQFSQLLATGWRPSYHEIFLAQLQDGTNVFVTVEQLVHIALSGATRNGKTEIIRQLLSQLIYVGCDCILLDPHFTPYDIEKNEDWTPFIPKLKFDPVECKEYRRIEQIVEYAATKILPKRMALRTQSKPLGKPIFLMIDEYPSIIARCPNVEKHIGALLREGAKYRIFLCIASHDFLVQTAFPSMGSGLRDCLKTIFHVGGNIRTARELLDIEKIDRDEEASLGKGLVYLKCETHKKAQLANTAWMDDEAIHQLVGPSTYESDDLEIDDGSDDDLSALNGAHGDIPVASKGIPPNAERGTRSAEPQTEGLESTEETERPTRNADLPDGWTQQDADDAIRVYKNLHNRDLTLKAIGKGQGKDGRANLATVLKLAGIVEE